MEEDEAGKERKSNITSIVVGLSTSFRAQRRKTFVCTCMDAEKESYFYK